MSILRTEKQVAFNDLLVAVEEARNDYEDFIKVLGDPQVGEVFRILLQERIAIAKQLAAAIRAMDDLPSLPDADKEDFGKLVHRIRAALVEDELPHALHELINDEQRTLELAQNCRQQALNATEENIVTQLLGSVDRALARLREMAGDTAS